MKKIVVSVGGPPKEWDLQAEAIPQGLNWDLWMGPNVTERPYNNILAPQIEDRSGQVARLRGLWRRLHERLGSPYV